MILNVYAILDAFVTVLRLGLAVLVVVLAWRSWRAWRRADSAEARATQENRSYLVLLLSMLLLVLNFVSWPLLYLLLESYVPEWPGVMCIYGVTQVGSGSQGASRFLPALLKTLQALKPALVFASGVWMMLYLANRRTAHSPLMSRVLLAAIAVGIVAATDAVAEGAYLLIPKKEEFLSAGCCIGDMQNDSERFLPRAIVGENGRAALSVAFWAINGAMAVGLFVSVRLQAARGRVLGLGLLLPGALAAALVSGVFLIDVAAPALLHQPDHHCPYDLIPRVPEAVLGIAACAVATLAVGWASVTARFADCPETRPFLHEQVRRILVVALFGYLCFITLIGVELALA